MSASDWLILQLADSAFPTGGFAHSGGLEAAVQLGEVASAAELERFVAAALWQAGTGALPLVRAAHAAPARLGELDARCHAFLTGHVANRASRTQGRAFAATCARSFDAAEVAAIDDAVRTGALRGHLAPTFGAVLAALAVPAPRALALHLHLVLRTVLSAAVRLGRIGPHEAQRLQRGAAPLCDEVLAACGALEVDDLAQSAPVWEVAGTLHDTLYSRLFQS